MNNDKRIILAIALYAAVITMVLHTLSSEGHERFSITGQSTQYQYAADPGTTPPLSADVLCTEVQCTDEDRSCLQPAKDDAPRMASQKEVVG